MKKSCNLLQTLNELADGPPEEFLTINCHNPISTLADNMVSENNVDNQRLKGNIVIFVS